MREVRPKEFLGWAAEAGIGVSPTHARVWPRNIDFVGGRVEPRYWVTPASLVELDRFVQSLMECMWPWTKLYLWPKCPGWLGELSEHSALCRVAAGVAGRVADAEGAIEFGRGEADAAALLLMCSAAYGWSCDTDVFFVSDRRDVILMVDHHRAVWAEFWDQARCDEFVAAMSGCGWELPTSPPDRTFREVGWMRRGGG